MRRTAQLLRSLLSVLITIVGQGIQFLWLAVSSRAELSAEVLFLRKQLGFYQEHQVRPRKLTDTARFSLVLVSSIRLENGIDDRQTRSDGIARGSNCFGGGSRGWEGRGFRKIFAS
jgi:hypothetical protein